MGMQGVIPPNIDYSKSVSDGYKKKIYKKGETCIKYNKLYQAKEDIDEPEEWNPEHWKETTVEQIRAQMQQEIEAVNTKISNITPDDTAVGGKPWTSKHIVDMLCPPLKVSGNPVQCYPVEGYPLGITASWEPTQEGTGDPSPDNIRPIKGRDSVAVTRCGANMYSGEGLGNVTWADNYTEMVDALNALPTGVYYINLVFSLNEYSEKYTSDTAEANALRINVRGNGSKDLAYTNGKTITKKTKLPLIEKIALGLNITEDIVGKIEKVHCYACGRNSAVEGAPSGPLGVGSIYNVSISATQPAEYTPYTGDTTTLTLPETIYGGSVDAVSGKGNKKWENIAFGAFADNGVFTYAGQFLYRWRISNCDNVICNKLKRLVSWKSPMSDYSIELQNPNYQNVVIFVPGMTTKEEYESWISENAPIFVYKRRNEIPFEASGAQDIKALSGVNTVLTDADSVEVTGRKDLIHAITGQ